MNMPKGIKHLEMLKGQGCKKCCDLRKRQTTLFRLTFEKDIVNESMKEVLPDRDQTSGIFCIFQNCDDNFMLLVENTMALN